MGFFNKNITLQSPPDLSVLNSSGIPVLKNSKTIGIFQRSGTTVIQIISLITSAIADKNSRNSEFGTPKQSQGRRNAEVGTPEQSQGRRNAEVDTPEQSQGKRNAEVDTPEQSQAKRYAEVGTPEQSQCKRNAEVDTPEQSQSKRNAEVGTSEQSQGRRNAEVQKRGSGNIKKYSGFLKKEFNKCKPVINEMVNTADVYLHYSNYVLFEINNTSSIVYLLILQISGSGKITGFILLILAGSKPAILYGDFIDTGKIFDGVIERYCGVPP